MQGTTVTVSFLSHSLSNNIIKKARIPPEVLTTDFKILHYFVKASRLNRDVTSSGSLTNHRIYITTIPGKGPALFRSVPRATLLVGCQGSHGHIRIPLDVLITGDRSSCFVADFFMIVKIIFFTDFSYK